MFQKEKYRIRYKSYRHWYLRLIQSCLILNNFLTNLLLQKQAELDLITFKNIQTAIINNFSTTWNEMVRGHRSMQSVKLKHNICIYL